MIHHLDGYMNTAQAADLMQITEGSVRKLVRSGKLPAVRRGTSPRGRLLIPNDAVRAYLRDVFPNVHKPREPGA